MLFIRERQVYAIHMKKTLTAYALSSLLLLPAGFGANKPLPDTGDPSARTLSVFKENLIGKEFIAAVKQQLPMSYDGLAREYISNLGNRLVAASNTPKRTFHFYLLNIDDINAFAGPGGYICVNRGLITNSRNESELAAVMAHEIAHVRQRHIARMMESSKGNKWSMLAGLLAAIAASAAGSPDAAMGAISAAMTASAAHMMAFSRHEEQEADNVGMRILRHAGFNPHAMARFFGKMQEQQMAYGQEAIPSIFMSHPATPIRIAEAQARASEYPDITPPSSLNYQLLKIRLQVQAIDNPAIAVNRYQKYVKNKPHNLLLRYGYALALARNHKPRKALAALKPLFDYYHRDITIKHHGSEAKPITHALPSNLFIDSLQAELLASTKQTAAAMALLKKTQKQFPKSKIIILQQAKTLYLAGRLVQAEALLEDALLDHPTNANYYHLLAQVEAAQNKFTQATESEAEARILSGHYQLALDNLQALIREKSLSQFDRLRIQGKISRLQKRIKQLRRYASYK